MRPPRFSAASILAQRPSLRNDRPAPPFSPGYAEKRVFRRPALLLSSHRRQRRDVQWARDIDSLGTQLNTKIDTVVSHFNATHDSLKDSIAAAKVWALVLYIALAAAMRGTMARGFEWL